MTWICENWSQIRLFDGEGLRSSSRNTFRARLGPIKIMASVEEKMDFEMVI